MVRIQRKGHCTDQKKKKTKKKQNIEHTRKSHIKETQQKGRK